ncbi:TLC domain-containing protein [Spinellus fusiger]|nr:TLC domain-containing protein [Spinellus fusiger]
MTVLVNQQPKKPDPPLKAKRQTQHKSLAERAHGIELEITGVLVLTVVAGYTQGFGFAKKCLLLSYGKAPNAYGKGINDIYFVCFWIVAFSFLQTVMSKYIYHPIALWGGIKSDAKRQRLAEQLSTFFYYSTFWLMGMYIMYHSPYWLDTSHFWIDYPHMLMTPLMKAYYLMQTAFYIQQIYAINVEKWRKDHFAMVFHHIIAITLLASSYYSNFTRIGNAVLCCMDLADVLLSLAKVLKYSNRTTLCDVVFGLFAVAWPVTRHGFFLVIFGQQQVRPIRWPH